jgi:hypothetical protein
MEFFFNPITGRVEQLQVNDNLPFRSMADMANEINQFPFLPPNSTTPLDAFKNTVAPVPPFNPKSMQSIFPTNVQTGIISQAPKLGFDTSFGVANEEDTEQVDFLGTKPNRAQEGIAKLFEFLQRFSPVANIARGVESLRNRFDTNRAIRADVNRDTQGTINTITSPRITNIKPTARDRGMGRQRSSQRDAGPGFNDVSEAGSF